jgi:hypothetical protein
MRVVPEKISMKWIETLSDADLIEVEARVHAKFALLERREKKERGEKYQLMMRGGSAELMEAWDRWSRILAATRERSLVPLREPADS